MRPQTVRSKTISENLKNTKQLFCPIMGLPNSTIRRSCDCGSNTEPSVPFMSTYTSKLLRHRSIIYKSKYNQHEILRDFSDDFLVDTFLIPNTAELH